MMFGSQETIQHNYSYLNETLGLRGTNFEQTVWREVRTLTSTTNTDFTKIYKPTKKNRSW